MNEYEKIKDARDSRCSELISGYAFTQLENRKIHATNTTKKDGPFFCAGCMSEVIVRKCADKKDHFAHRAEVSSVLMNKESELHKKCCAIICEYLKSKYPQGAWEVERPISKENKVVVIPDISGRIDNNQRLVIEVQKSTLSINKLLEKIEIYKSYKLPVLYIVPLHKPLSGNPYRPRLFEKFLHSFYYGRIYYWVVDEPFKLLPVHFSPEFRFIPLTEFFDTEIMEMRSFGGHYMAFKTVKKPLIGPALTLPENFKINSRTQFVNTNYKYPIPEAILFHDSLERWWDKGEFEKIKHTLNLNKQNNEFGNYDFMDVYDQDFE
jgi:hypothetical protein